MRAKRTHWASLLTLIVLGGSLFFTAALTFFFTLSSLTSLVDGAGDAAGAMISAFAFGIASLLLCVCGWFVLQKTRGLEQADLPFAFPHAVWLWLVVPAAVFSCLTLGALVSFVGIPWLNWLALPALTMVVVAAPIWLFYGSAAKGLDLGPRWRFFTIFGFSLIVPQVIMLFLETVALIAFVVAGAVYVATQPDLAVELERLSGMITETMNEEALLNLVAPYVANPALIAVGFSYISLVVPLIEELFKPLAVWLFVRRIESPAQGYALGVLCGAAFALLESLNASANGTTFWAVVVTARIGTSALHMATSGLAGWGIVSAFQERRARRFLAAYFSSVLMHGVWNASAAGLGLTALGQTIGKPEWMANFAPALLCNLMVMGMGLVAILLLANRKLRAVSDGKQAEAQA